MCVCVCVCAHGVHVCRAAVSPISRDLTQLSLTVLREEGLSLSLFHTRQARTPESLAAGSGRELSLVNSTSER